jgi:hypothetical protein
MNRHNALRKSTGVFMVLAILALPAQLAAVTFKWIVDNSN